MSIHNEENTDIKIIEQKYEEYGDKNNNCVLIITGSLNPIHRSHIKNLQLVKKYLEKHPSRPLNVLAGYLSPTHDSYVRQKLGGHHWISAEDRCNLCNEAIVAEGEQSWLSVSKGECKWEDGLVDFDDVSTNLAKFLNLKLHESNKPFKYPIKVVYVCGLDHFNKCSHVASLANEENIACAVIYRLGAHEDRIKRLEKSSSDIYYISLEDERSALVDISSTKVREKYGNSVTTDDDSFTYPKVNDFLKNKYSK